MKTTAFRVVAVDMEDRRFDDLGNIGAVGRRTAVERVAGREPDLVVDDDMDRAADRVSTCLRHIERLHVDALSGECRITMEDDRQHLGAVGIEPAVCCRARTEPCTTGLMISRCEGLKPSVMCTRPPGVSTSLENPLWYFTSPDDRMPFIRRVPLTFELAEDLWPVVCR